MSTTPSEPISLEVSLWGKTIKTSQFSTVSQKMHVSPTCNKASAKNEDGRSVPPLPPQRHARTSSRFRGRNPHATTLAASHLAGRAPHTSPHSNSHLLREVPRKLLTSVTSCSLCVSCCCFPTEKQVSFCNVKWQTKVDFFSKGTPHTQTVCTACNFLVSTNSSRLLRNRKLETLHTSWTESASLSYIFVVFKLLSLKLLVVTILVSLRLCMIVEQFFVNMKQFC